MSWLTRLQSRFGKRDPQKTLGARGEDVAARFLRRQGYKIVGRGQRDRLGEVDVIAVDQRTVVFVEVKTRRSTDKGHPADAVHDEKQRRLTRLALSYLKRHNLLECSSRFDVIAITWPSDNEKPKIEHFKNAFSPIGQGQMFS